MTANASGDMVTIDLEFGEDPPPRLQAMEGAVKQVALIGEQLFDHKAVLRPVIERFVDSFEKNQRHKEFDGILRASHLLVEAAETASGQMLAEGRLEHLNERIKRVADRIDALVDDKYQEEHTAYLSAIKTQQGAYVELCEREAMRKMKAAAGVHQEEDGL